MTDARGHLDPEKNGPGEAHLAAMGHFGQGSGLERLESNVNITPFVGRLGGNGLAALVRDESNQELLASTPDAAPLMTFAQAFDLRPFRSIDLWKAALIEGMGKMPGIRPF
jgi:hypothetical protein